MNKFKLPSLHLHIVFFIIVLIIISLQTTFAKTTILNKATKTLVVVYSYGGNTRKVADTIIKRFKADLITIEADKYLGFIGKMKAGIDSWTEVKITDIKPKTININQYDLIFLGSPIWWYRPAVPLWTFITLNNFKGKKVVLFNTFNSRFKSNYIDEFKKFIENKGGKFIDHIYVRRGRWYNQLSRDELLEKFNNLLNKKEKYYESISI